MKSYARQAAMLLTAILGLHTSTTFAASYSISAFNMTLGGDYAESLGLNSQGAVVGQSNTSHETLIEVEPGLFDSIQDTHAFTFYNGVITDLGTLGGINSQGARINDLGVVVGYSDSAGGNPRAFMYDGGLMTDLGTLGGSNSGASSINNNNQIVGWATTSTNYSHAFLYENGVMTDLGTLGGSISTAQDINNNGQVVGRSWLQGGTLDRAFVYENGVMQDLGVLPGTITSRAIAINDVGQIIGESGQHAFFYDNGVMTELFGLSSGVSAVWLSDINNDGVVVGSSKSPIDGYYDAVMWDDGALINLNSFVSDDWSLNYATAINDSGQILGSGYYQGMAVSYILTPVPIPAAAWLFGSGLLGLVGMARTTRKH